MEAIVSAGGGEGHEAVVTVSEIEGSPSPQPVSVVHVTSLPPGIQVQSVLNSQPSVIQTASGHTIQAIQVIPAGAVSDGELGDDEISRKRREILARRPSYRKILNELSSDSPAITVAKIEEESNGSQTSQDSQDGTEGATNLSTSSAIQYQQATVVPAQTIQIAAGDGVNTSGLQTLTMTNSSSNSPPGGGATIVQYAQGPDGQFFIPVSTLSAGTVQAYQITTPTSLPQGVVMATAGTTIASPQQLSEEASRKRELRLLKNRDAAKECRRKKKEYIKCLENRVAVLENQNKTLVEELKSLKELYCQKTDG